MFFSCWFRSEKEHFKQCNAQHVFQEEDDVWNVFWCGLLQFFIIVSVIV